MQEILKRIIDRRMESIKEKGINFGIEIPEKRKVPLSLPDLGNGLIICEIKRGSPSEGRMNNIEEPEVWAMQYIEGGANVISVLTEENFFYGGLTDLINIKNKFPGISVLRKDFLLSPDEIEISYRIGADLVLLIASVLTGKNNDLVLLKQMMDKTEEMGMLPLVEVHDKNELENILILKPKLIGINSRDLDSFKINRNYPVGLKSLVNDNIYVIFESGIRNKLDAFFVGISGFSGILAGTSIVKSGRVIDKVKEIKEGFFSGKNNKSEFYLKIFKKIYIDKKLVVKICGITNLEDARLVVENHADILGFIFAVSPRQITFKNAKKISNSIGNNILKVGVVVDEFIDEAIEAVREGWLDAIQFHGDIDIDEISGINVPWYKAVRVSKKEDFDLNYFCPITLYDAFSKEAYGGTGKLIDKGLLDYAIEKNIDLFLAGGINPDNVVNIIENYKPLLIDVSSGLEKEPGKKDPEKVKNFFNAVKKFI